MSLKLFSSSGEKICEHSETYSFFLFSMLQFHAFPENNALKQLKLKLLAYNSLLLIWHVVVVVGAERYF
jgi:hypothetical protein